MGFLIISIVPDYKYSICNGPQNPILSPDGPEALAKTLQGGSEERDRPAAAGGSGSVKGLGFMCQGFGFSR